MIERVQCLLLFESGGGQVTRSSRNSSASVHALLPRIFKDTCPDVIEFFKKHNIQTVDSACKSGPHFYSTARTTKLDILEVQLTIASDGKSEDKKLTINVHESNKEIAQLLFLGSVNQIRFINSYTECVSFSAIDEENVRFIEDCLAHGVEFSYRHHNGGTLLHFAVQEVNLALVKAFLKHGCVVDTANSESWTPLHVAARHGNFKIVKTLVEHGGNVNARTGCVEGDTPLILAADSGNLKVVKFLLHRGADINVVNHYHCRVSEMLDGEHSVTPLHLAARNGYTQVVDLLAKRGARIDVRAKCLYFNCPSPLMSAAEKGHFKVVKLLLDSGADVHGGHYVESPVGMTALHHAAKNGHLETVKILLKEGANINARTKAGSTPLLLATELEHTEVVEHFLVAGADINVVYYSKWNGNGNGNSKERSILVIALETENQELFDLTLSRRSNLCNDVILKAFYVAVCRLTLFCRQNVDFLFPSPFTIDNESLQNVDETRLLFGAIHKSRPDIVEQLLKKGVDVNSRLHPCGSKLNRVTPLHWAVSSREERMIRLLLKYGAEVDALDEKGHSPALFAIATHSIDILKLLIKNKADVRKPELMIAAVAGSNDDSLEVVEFLLQNGAHPDAYLDDSGTLTIVAVAKNRLRLLKLLLKFGASIQCTRKDETYPSVTLLHYAIASKKSKFFQFLLDFSFQDLSILYGIYYLVLYDDLARPFASEFGCHVIKMISAGLPICDDNLGELKTLWRVPEDFQNCCEAEICMLKNEKLERTDINWYDILIKNVDRVTAYARNDCVVQAFETENYRNRFPIYAGIIECQFKKGRHRRDLLTQGIRVFTSLFKHFSALPDELKEKIVSLLDNRELQMLRCI